MNILYLSPMLIDEEHLDGVARKLLFQRDALGSIGENDKIYLASFFSEDKYLVKGPDFEQSLPFVNKNSKQLNMFQVYPQIPVVCEDLKIDAVYFRMMALSWVTEKLFSELHRNNIKIVIEIPTYPFWKEKWMDVVDNLKAKKIGTGIKRAGTNIVYWFYAHRVRKYVSKIVTFSNITQLWGIDVIGISNGYNFEIPNKETKLVDKNAPLNLLMVASIRDNHGLDRIINGMINYVKNGGTREINFHIVGDGEVIPELKKMAQGNAVVKDHVIFYGFKSGSELDKIYERADLGVSVLAFHRLGVTYCSPLKSKEYFAKGLPIIGTSAEEDIMSSPCSKYYFAAPQNDLPIDMKAVVEFYDLLENEGTTDRDIILEASKVFDWKSIMKPVYQAFKN